MTKDTIEQKYLTTKEFHEQNKMSVYLIKKACLKFGLFYKKIPVEKTDDILMFKESKDSRNRRISFTMNDDEFKLATMASKKMGLGKSKTIRELIRRFVNEK